MRLRLIPIAAGTALLAVSLLGAAAAAAEGEVVLGSSSSNPVSITDPAAGECIPGIGLYGSSVDNLTDATVELYDTQGCKGTPFAVLAPGESRMISLDTQVAALRARS